MADFPVTLPKPLASGYSGTKTQAFIRTEMEAGSQRQRKRFSAVNQNRSLNFLFTASEMDTFKDFFETDINQGSDFFNISLDFGNGFTTYAARFIQPYTDSYVDGGFWNVDCQLEVRNA
jgi:hypothetical protein